MVGTGQRQAEGSARSGRVGIERGRAGQSVHRLPMPPRLRELSAQKIVDLRVPIALFSQALKLFQGGALEMRLETGIGAHVPPERQARRHPHAPCQDKDPQNDLADFVAYHHFSPLAEGIMPRSSSTVKN